MKIENTQGGRIDGENDLIISTPKKPAFTIYGVRGTQLANVDIVSATDKKTVNRAVEKWFKENEIVPKRKRDFKKIKHFTKKCFTPFFLFSFILWLFSDLINIYLKETNQ